MPTYRPLLNFCLLNCLALLSGCGASTSATVDVSSDDDQFLGDLMAELDDADSDSELDASELDASNDEDLMQPVSASKNVLAEPVEPARLPSGGQLELNLQTGDRFPLVKTIRQQLVQTSAMFPANAESQLQMHMLIQVEDANPQAILMNVRYTRITYSHVVNGQSVTFDSDRPQGSVPAAVVPYAGMVNNGFAFWLGRDNRIQRTVGYQEFLQRCVQQVPAERRQALLTEVSARFGDDGVANFIDDTVGLLPYNHNASGENPTRVAVGDVWYRERQLQTSSPVLMKSTCRLLALTDETAEIDITGQIANGETYELSSGQTRVQVREGRSMGSCIIDRATGLPLKLNRSRYLNMVVTTADGQQYEQEKRIETTIQTYPNTRGPVAQAPPSRLNPAQQLRPMPGDGFKAQQFGIRQVNGVQPLPGERVLQPLGGLQAMPAQAEITHLKSDVQAVYPD